MRDGNLSEGGSGGGVTRAANVVRIITANLASGKADVATFTRIVEAWQPDAVAVQEIDDVQARHLAGVLPFGTLEAKPVGTGMGIALPKPGPVAEICLPYRSAYSAELEAAGQCIELVNIHVIAPQVAPIWRTARLRRRQLRGLEHYLDERVRPLRVVVGDLNATPLWPVYRRLARRLKDGALEVARRRGCWPARTWGPFPGWPRLLRIDHVLTRGLILEGLHVLTVPGSDHCAVVADLRPVRTEP